MQSILDLCSDNCFTRVLKIQAQQISISDNLIDRLFDGNIDEFFYIFNAFGLIAKNFRSNNLNFKMIMLCPLYKNLNYYLQFHIPPGVYRLTLLHVRVFSLLLSKVNIAPRHKSSRKAKSNVG